jgi:hypothetical protein
MAAVVGMVMIFAFREQVSRPAKKAEQTRTEIGQLAAAIEAFKARYKVSYLPSRINLFSPTTADATYLATLWPSINIAQVISSGNWPRAQLEGHQCLVFFLGGNQKEVNGMRVCEGFSQNPRNPAEAGGKRDGPFFDFESDRLLGKPTTGFAYADAFGQPYVFFSSGWKPNAYLANPVLGVSPYRMDEKRFWNPQSFQIISAGPDGKFGPGGVWSPTNIPAAYQRGQNGYDDITNFYEQRMGIPPG